MDLKVKKTTYKVEGCDEPCWEVSDGYTLVRIARYYHYIGADTLIVSEYLDGDFNSEEEIAGDFEMIDRFEAISIAKSQSAYLS